MGTQTGTAADTADLLDKLRLFAIAEGFTVDRWSARPDQPEDQVLMLAKGDLRVAFQGTRTDTKRGLEAFAYPAYDGALNPLDQVDRSARVPTNDLVGPYQAYDFYAGTGLSGPYLHVVVETAPGLFRHFGTGIVNKLGAVTNGQYLYGTDHYLDGAHNEQANPHSSQHAWPFDDYNADSSNAGMVVRAAVDDRIWSYTSWPTNEFSYDVRHGRLALRTGYREAASSQNHGEIAPGAFTGNSQVNGVVPLRPLIMSVRRTGDFYSPIGYAPGVRFVHLRGVATRQVLSRGNENWRCYPVIRKNGLSPAQSSGEYGLAYLANP